MPHVGFSPDGGLTPEENDRERNLLDRWTEVQYTLSPTGGLYYKLPPDFAQFDPSQGESKYSSSYREGNVRLGTPIGSAGARQQLCRYA